MTTTQIPAPTLSLADACRVELPQGKLNNISIEHFEIAPNSIENLRNAIRGGRATPPGTYTQLWEGNRLWMSDTRAEVYDHLYALYQMKSYGGRVLINGLGLGMVIKAALTLPNIEHVDVVEANADIIALVGPHYESERCTIHHADAFTMQWPPRTRWTVAWHDIWPHICADNLPEYTKLKRKYGSRVQWQGCWAEELIRR